MAFFNHDQSYDSTKDTLLHINNIHDVFNTVIIPELVSRSNNHDLSKLESPEKQMYDKYIPLLRLNKYGTKEYNKTREDMLRDGLQHHYDTNRHHPQHFKNGIRDMTIIDLVELFSDWVAASKVSDTSFIDGLSSNKRQFNISDDLIQIFTNTFNEYFK